MSQTGTTWSKERELIKKKTCSITTMRTTNHSKGQHSSPSSSSPSTTTKEPETEDKTKKNRHNRSWSTTFHLARGCVEFGSLVLISVLSLLFLATNVSVYDSSRLASTTYYGANTNTAAAATDTDFSNDKRVHDNHQKIQHITNKKNDPQFAPLLQHDSTLGSQRTTSHNAASSSSSWLDSLTNKLSLSTSAAAATALLQQTTTNNNCETLEELTLTPSLQAIWFEIDETVARFPDLPVSGGIFLYPRQRSILTVLVQAMSVGREVLQQQERQRRKALPQFSQEPLYIEPPLRICESGFAAGHSAALFLHATDPDNHCRSG
jgi:hypothetical protein